MCLLYCACHATWIFADPVRMSHACHRFWNCHKNPHVLLTLARYTISCACHTKRRLNVKSGPIMWYFWHLDFQMCFAARRRALFKHRNFQKLSEHVTSNVLRAFWLQNVLRDTTAFTFSTSQLPHGSAPAALASLLFDPPEPQIIGKTQCFATFLPFRAPASSFFSSLIFSLLLFSSLWLFPSLLFICPYCRKFDF